MTIAEAVVGKREQLFDAMVATADPTVGTSEADIRQFAAGFIEVLEASARGDHSARELYLTSVIPALRGGPLSFHAVLGAMIRVAAAAASVLGPEHVRWVADYCADYTARLICLWEGAR